MNIFFSRESSTSPAVSNDTPAAAWHHRALCVGIDHYPEWNALENAQNDAAAVAHILHAEYGFEVQLVPEAEATYKTLSTTIETELKTATANSRWLFYFAGHGLVKNDLGYLLPTDAQRGNVERYLPLAWLIKQCKDSPCGQILLILDACYSGQALVKPTDFSDEIPADEAGARVRHLLASGTPDQRVLDGGGHKHSVFTQSLLDALEGWAGIHTSDGAIPFPALFNHLVADVPTRLEAMGLGATQQPIGGNLGGNRHGKFFTLQATVPRLTPELARDARSADPNRRRASLAQLVAESQAHPNRHALAVQLALRHLPAHPTDQSPMVTPTLRYEPAAAVRAQAATTLGTLGAVSATPVLTDALQDTAHSVVQAAAHALGRLKNMAAAPALLARLKTADETLFLELVAALGALGETANKLETFSLDTLRECLRHKRLVLCVGPDFPQALTGLPPRAALAQTLAQREELPPNDSLATVAAQTMHGDNRYTFTAFLKHALDDPLKLPGPIHTALAQLPIPLWLNATYDGLLAKTLKANHIVSGSDASYVQPNRPTVVSLLGALNNPRSLVVTEKDYEQLRADETDRRQLVNFLQKELSGKVVLFIGFDPTHADFKLLTEKVFGAYLAQVALCAFMVVEQMPTVEMGWGSTRLWPLLAHPLAILAALK